jgi:hypothetical protein
MEKQRGGEASARRRFGAAVSGMADRSCSSDLCSNWCDGGADRARQKKTATGCADAWRCAGDGKAAAGAELRLATPVRPKRQRRAGLAGDAPPLPRGSPLRPPQPAVQRPADGVEVRTQMQRRMPSSQRDGHAAPSFRVTHRFAAALASRLLGGFPHHGVPLQQGFATWPCYRDRGCGTLSPRLTSSTTLCPLRASWREGSRSPPRMASSCNTATSFGLSVRPHPLSNFTIQGRQTARRVHTDCCCTLPYLVVMDSAVVAVKVNLAFGQILLETQYKTDTGPRI